VTKVEFRVEAKLVTTVSAAPCKVRWSSANSLSYGTHTIVVRAYDDSGLTKDSATATIKHVR
jgi:hypothetical protein